MAYLTEHFSNPPVIGGKLNSAEGGVSIDSPDLSNVGMARSLSEEKENLIRMLCQFPVTALWLFDQYREERSDDESDDEAVWKTAVASVLADVKKHYQTMAQAWATQGASAGYSAEKENLARSLQQFSYSFDDLTGLVDVIAYAYKLRGLTYQPGQYDARCRPEVVMKRLEGRRRRGAKALALFKDWGVEDEAFLFLTTTEMQALFVELVAAEYRWLSARQALAAANAKLVLFIANQYKATFLDFDDLVQEGHTGLLKAVDRFDYRLGFQFSTYAGYWIRQAISRALSRSERVVRIPCGQVANINKVYRAKEELSAKFGREPSTNELADYLAWSRNEVEVLLSISQTALSLEAQDDDEDTFSPIDFLEQRLFAHPFNTIARADLDTLLKTAIDALNPREAKVVCAHFGIDIDREMTLQEIGCELNLTRERIRQIQVAALNKIKDGFGESLACFL